MISVDEEDGDEVAISVDPCCGEKTDPTVTFELRTPLVENGFHQFCTTDDDVY